MCAQNKWLHDPARHWMLRGKKEEKRKPGAERAKDSFEALYYGPITITTSPRLVGVYSFIGTFSAAFSF